MIFDNVILFVLNIEFASKRKNNVSIFVIVFSYKDSYAFQINFYDVYFLCRHIFTDKRALFCEPIAI